MFSRAVELVTQSVEEARFAHSPGASVTSATFLNTQFLKTLDVKMSGQAKDSSAAILALEQATDQYHSLGNPSETQASTIPAGATLAAFLKIFIWDASSSFNFFMTFLSAAKMALISGHITGLSSSFPLIVYQALARLDIAGDKERVEILNWLITVANLTIGVMEAIIHGDLQKALALAAQAFFVLSHAASTIEAWRTLTNQQCSALVDRRSRESSTINPFVQPMLIDALKQDIATNVVMGKLQLPPTLNGQFFLAGGSDGASIPSASRMHFNWPPSA
jgi:hypothetical protein